MVSFWWFVFNTSISWKTNNMSEIFTFNNTKRKSLGMWKIGNSHDKWCLVRRVKKGISLKTIWQGSKYAILSNMALHFCLTMIVRICQCWYYIIIGWSWYWWIFSITNIITINNNIVIIYWWVQFNMVLYWIIIHKSACWYLLKRYNIVVQMFWCSLT